jgi:hypothetical protein
MQELVGRLAEVDPDAGAAVKVIVYFDRLVEGGAGLEPIVRGAAVLAGCAARLVDDERGVSVRVDAQGRVGGEIGLPDPEWLSTSLLPQVIECSRVPRAKRLRSDCLRCWYSGLRDRRAGWGSWTYVRRAGRREPVAGASVTAGRRRIAGPMWTILSAVRVVLLSPCVLPVARQVLTCRRDRSRHGRTRAPR